MSGHALSNRWLTPRQRITNMTIPDGDCLIWQGAVIGGSDNKSYANFRVAGKRWLVHRWLWTETHGAIPEGLTIDHICARTRCLNIDHLQVVTRG